MALVSVTRDPQTHGIDVHIHLSPADIASQSACNLALVKSFGTAAALVDVTLDHDSTAPAQTQPSEGQVSGNAGEYPTPADKATVKGDSNGLVCLRCGHPQSAEPRYGDHQAECLSAWVPRATREAALASPNHCPSCHDPLCLCGACHAGIGCGRSKPLDITRTHCPLT